MFDPVDILPKLPENFYTELESKKWLERKTALDNLLQLLSDNPRLCPKAQYGNLVDALRLVLEKDSNINVASVAAKCLTCLARGLRQKFAIYATSLPSVIFEKFKEKKPTLRDPLTECIDATYATTQLETFVEDIMTATAKPNPQIRIQLYAFLYRAFKSMKTTSVPKKFLKDLVPVLIKHTADPDPEVRDAACSALGSIMKCIGQKAATVLYADLASDKMKMAKVEEFFNKAVEEAKQEEAAAAEKAPKPIGTKTSAQDADDSEPSAGVSASKSAAVTEPQIDPWDMFDPVDILPKIPDNFKTELESKKWLERKTALEALLQLLTDNPRLCPKAHYGDLVETLKRVLEKDSNINVASVAAKCVTCLANGLRQKFGVHGSTIAPVIFEKFKEKKPVLRDPLIECMDAIYSTTQLEALAEDIMTAASKPNPNIKIQLDLFLYRVFKQLKSAAVPKKFIKDLVPVLIKHTADPDPEVRDAACSALGAIMKCIGQKPAMILFGEFAQDKVKMTKPPKVVKNDAPKRKPESRPSSRNSQENEDDGCDEPLKLGRGTGANDAGDTSDTGDGSSTTNGGKGRPTIKKPVKKDRSSSQFKQQKDDPPKEDTLLNANSDRVARAKEEKTLKLLKWNFDQPTAEHILQLNEQITEVCKPSLATQIHSKDFKQHLKAIEYLQELLNSNPLPIVNNIDLLLKWSTLRFFDTNPAVLIKVLEFLNAVFAYMDANNESLYDSEMAAFLPYLLLKDYVKTPFIYQPNISSVIYQISGQQVRNAALNAIVTVYKKIGDRVYTLIGQLNEKEKAMLDERIKRSGRNGGPESEQRPATVRESSVTRLNSTFSTPVRARSSSATRRAGDMNTSNLNSTGVGAELLPPAPPQTRRSMGSAMSSSGSKFQLDAKFFNDDFDNTMFNGTAKFDSNNIDVMDLKPIQPIVRPANSSFTKRSESVSSISSLESAEHIDRTVHNLSCLSLNIADEAIAQLLHLLHDPINRNYIVDRTEIILKTFVTQFFHIRSQHLEHLDENSPEGELSEFMRSVCNFLSTLVKDDVIVGKITVDTMRSFVDAILSLVADNRLNNLAGSRQIFRSLNVVVIRICEFSNPNSCFVALMRLLIKYQASEPEGRIIYLIRKCLFKHVDVFLDPAKYEKLDLLAVFGLLHEYFSKFYVGEPVPESVKETCRTLNVYIQRLVVTKRYKVLNYLYPYPENGQLVTYVRRCVRALVKSDQAKTGENDDPNQTAMTTVEQSTTKKSPPEELISLFRRVSEDIFDGCVEELYNFMDVHPEQNGNFEELMNSCEYSCIIRRAFGEIRRTRIKKEPMAIGESVRLVLPPEDRLFIEKQCALQKKIDDALCIYNVQKNNLNGGTMERAK
ncbi:HEAT repeat domain-containing protein [Ditylenchus destructor]|uniref:HEAT repeat domain-containing protein n=1 Tax=Ditylenchus destructor TaxID=166010 RepID=A0AAD4NI12_9BILA|nr:HEAT repeat domain-containing protein [Ditylenchus destructor]